MRIELKSVQKWNEGQNTINETTRGSIEVNRGNNLTLVQIVVRGPKDGIRHIVNMSRNEVVEFATKIINNL